MFGIVPDVLMEVSADARSRTMKPTFEQTEEFYRQVESGRITRENLQEFLKNPGKVLVAAITATFASLLKACHQNGYCNSDFTEDRWPLESIAADENDWEVVGHYLTKTGALEDGVKQLEKLATKGEIRLLTGSRRAMEYIAAHPDAQLDHPIILPLRAQDSSDFWCLPVFYGYWIGRQRGLNLCSTGITFDSGYGWLVLRKRQK